MPTNLYGPGDNFDLEKSHVLPAMIRKFHEAKLNGSSTVTLWGTGKALREFLHVDDMADACLFLLHRYDDPEIINIGVGKELTIADLADTVRSVVGFQGEIVYDATKPDGTPRKLVDVSKINSLGWRAKITLRQGIQKTYRWFLDNAESLRGL
jgi:GDP-L-fucose synthase